MGLIAHVLVQIPKRCDSHCFQMQRMNPSVLWHGKISPITSNHHQIATCGFRYRFPSRHYRLWAMPDAYYRLDNLIWRGSEAEALQPGSLPEQLTPPWKITLLSDGSVTRHLQLMTGQTVTVECLEMQDVGLFSAQSIPGKAYIPQTEEEFRTVRRQVFLKMSDEVERPYVYASSWWRRDVVDEYLKDRSKPIWTSLSSERTELFREIIEVEHGYCGELERHFGCKGPFWARTYIFWHNQKPLTVIYEVFSPRLHEFLGPSCSL